ncbi:transcriptional regulator family: Fungal Specific TF [Paecilomyces variotii]|nr:transcriptional regulator family: Fungal Specific TF [Paecilomyces variotii]
MPKVKTGCITCKIRRVKCDEEKPACRRCRSSKRKCDGYNEQSNGHKPTSTYHTSAPRISPDSRLVLRPGTREERQYAELFCTRTSQAIAGFFASEFWGRVLPQLSFREPAVRHAIIAVSATHEQRILAAASSVQQSSTVSQTQRNERFVLEQYNKAIYHLVAHSSSPTGGRVEPTLITCCLFIFLEIIRGNFSQALNHVEAGLNIITDLKRRGILDAVDKELVELFVRLNIQKSLFGRPLITLNAPKPIQDSSSCCRASFSTIPEARVLLDSLTERALKFIRLTKSGQDCSMTTTELLGEQAHITTALDDWSRQFENLTKKSKRTKQSDSRGPLILKMQYLVARIWLKTCLSPDEMVFDNHISDFEEIISNASTFMNEATNSQNKKDESYDTFCGDMGIIPPLYYTAVKCREPILRRKAIDLISNYNRREGMWDGIMYAKVAEFVVAREEEKQGSLPVEMRTLPPSTCRVYEALIPEEATGDDNSVGFLLLLKPDGVNGDWYSEMRSIRW